ncbi:MAG: hypothetical protein FIA97_03345 [Methylococcaceae bacterium]|nr:hypothetical protein [Methylococcaceae bacterium]
MKYLPFLALLLLSACGGGYYGGSPSRYSGVDADDLLAFQADFAHKSAAARAEECRWLVKRQQQSPQLDWTLRLMIGRPLSESCGDPGRLVRAYESLSARQHLDRRAEGLGDYQAKVLQRLGYGGRRTDAAAERTEKSTAKGNGKDDPKLLREKLEAIRAIERDMDENQPAGKGR